MPTLVEEATQTLNELLRMHQLNQELLYALTEAIARIRIYAEKHGIPLSDLTMYDLLLEKANALISEIVNDSPLFLQHRKRTPPDKTEPGSRILLT